MLDSEEYAGANIKGGRIVLDYENESTTAATVRTLLTDSYNEGSNSFLSGQIESTTVTTYRGLGWVDDGTRYITVSYTLYGDTDLNGGVWGSDLTRLLSHYNQAGEWDWHDGDTNYDENVTGADLSKLLTNYNTQMPAPALTLDDGEVVNEGFDYTLTLDTVSEITLDHYDVNWGDGSTQPYTQAGQVTHQYTNAFTIPVISVDLTDTSGNVYAGVAGRAVTVKEPKSARLERQRRRQQLDHARELGRHRARRGRRTVLRRRQPNGTDKRLPGPDQIQVRRVRVQRFLDWRGRQFRRDRRHHRRRRRHRGGHFHECHPRRPG